MLSPNEARKYLKSGNYTEEELMQILDSIYQLAELLVNQYMTKKQSEVGNKNDKA